jgi:hypothetical protein
MFNRTFGRTIELAPDNGTLFRELSVRLSWLWTGRSGIPLGAHITGPVE